MIVLKACNRHYRIVYFHYERIWIDHMINNSLLWICQALHIHQNKSLVYFGGDIQFFNILLRLSYSPVDISQYKLLVHKVQVLCKHECVKGKFSLKEV